MTSSAGAHDALRVTTCDTPETLATAGVLFNDYRHGYGQPPDEDGRALSWLTEMVRAELLTVYTASVDGAGDAPPIGLPTSHEVPASLTMGRF